VLDWEGCFNVRDLAGLPTVDGRQIRDGALVRADSLNRLTEAGCAAARRHGISAVIDLRSAHELGQDEPLIRRRPGGPTLEQAGAHPFCAVEGVIYRQLRLRDFPDEEFAARVRDCTTQEQVYRSILRDGAGSFARIAREAIAAPPGAVVVHCAIGKDRTGLLIGVLLSAVGVPDDVVAADYARSAECLQPMRAFRASLGDPVRQFLSDDHLSPPETMLSLLAELRAGWGGADGYLRAGGLADEELAALRRRLVD
jgi:protein-tyrosine phosphatase